MTGTAFAQLLPFLASPLLTRLFSPEDFGLFAVYLGFGAVLSIFATGRYEFAIFLPRSEKSAINVLVICIALSLVFCALLFPLTFLIKFYGENHFNIIKTMGLAIYLIPLGALANALFSSCSYWVNRVGKYKSLAFSKLLRSITVTLISLILGYLGLYKLGLIIADVLGLSVAVAFLLYSSYSHTYSLKKYVSLLRIKRMAIRYIRFPKVMSFSSVAEIINTHLPNFLLTGFYSAEIAGSYALTQRVITSPVSFISRSVGDVFRQRASQEFSQTGNCRRIFDKTLKALALLAIIPALILLFMAPDLFRLFFGKEWELSGQFAQIMSLTFFLQFIASPISVMFMIAEKQKNDLYMQIYLLSAILISFTFTHYNFNSYIHFIYFLAGSYSLYYILFAYLSRNYTRKNSH